MSQLDIAHRHRRLGNDSRTCSELSLLSVLTKRSTPRVRLARTAANYHRIHQSHDAPIWHDGLSKGTTIWCNGCSLPFNISQLDVYYPPSAPSAPERTKPPILMFFHGGSLIHGARTWPERDLVHANLGAFFALQGILTVVVDYRLVPVVTYPGGSEDVSDAWSWVSRNLGDVGDTGRMFVLAHSAGGMHVAGLLLSPALYARVAVPGIRGVVLLGVPYEIPASVRTAADLIQAAELYYGNAKKVATTQPLGMLRRAEKEFVAALPPLRNMIAEREPRYISSAARAFGQLYASKGGRIENMVLDGHDHLSPIFALCSGQMEEWGVDVVEWLRNI